MNAIGQSVKRVDAVSKVTGAALYPGDIDLPGQLWMKILFAGRPHARIRAIDTSRAEQLAGVVAVFTAKDVPNNEYGLGTPDQPVLCGPGSDKLGGDVVRFIGDQVALVVAETGTGGGAGARPDPGGLRRLAHRHRPAPIDAARRAGAVPRPRQRHHPPAHPQGRRGGGLGRL